jgi:membrane-associated protein
MSLPFMDLPQLIQAVGYAGVGAIVFAESGLLIGFMLPGDSLLVTAGLLASHGFFSYPILAVIVFVAAVAGDAVGYTFGRRVGRRIFKRKGSLLFDPEHLRRAEEFYERHGGKAIIIARFMPFVRTFAPIVAGVGKMSYPRFAFFNVTGALLWAVGLSGLGYALGETVPGIDKYILPIIVFILIASASPLIWKVLSNREDRARLFSTLRHIWRQIVARVRR